MTDAQQDPKVPVEDQLFDEVGHVNDGLSSQEQFQALYDAGRHAEAMRILADVIFGTETTGQAHSASHRKTTKKEQ